MLKLPRILPALLVLTLAFAAVAQSRGPVVPNFQQPDAQQPAPSAAPASKVDEVDLVGPTEAQQKRAQAAAEAKARAVAESKARAEAESRVAAEAKIKAEAEARARIEAQARAVADAKLKAETEAQARLEAEARAAAEARARVEAEAQSRVRAEAEARVIAEARAKFAADEKARAEAQAEQRAADEARVAGEARRKLEREDAEALAQHQRGEAEARRQKLRDEAATRALAAVEARARAHEGAVENARVRALAQARRNDDARCAQKRSKKLQGDCRAMVAAKYESGPLTLPATGLPGTGSIDSSLALAPLVAPPPDRPAQSASGADRRAPVASSADRRVLAPSSSADRRGLTAVPAVAHDDRSSGARVASATSATSATSAEPAAPSMASGFTPVPREATEGARSRHAEVRNDLQVGPQSLVLNHLAAKAEISPDSLQAGFTYRLALDDAGAAHHLFGASLESARCPDDAGCGLRWFGFAGISPSAAQGFSVQRSVSGNTTSHTDQLGWSAGVGAAGLSYSGRLLSFAADGQLEALSIDYSRNTETAAPTLTSGTLDQLRLRGTAGIASGPWSGSLRVAGYVYAGNAPETFQLVPLRGALVDDDTAGLAGAPQSFQARLEGRYDSTSGLSLQASYGYLSYVGPYWISANLLAASVSQRFGHFRVGFGLVYEGETDRSGAGYPTLFGTGTLGASF